MSFERKSDTEIRVSFDTGRRIWKLDVTTL